MVPHGRQPAILANWCGLASNDRHLERHNGVEQLHKPPTASSLATTRPHARLRGSASVLDDTCDEGSVTISRWTIWTTA
jgi:hypothetical protein